MFLIDSVSLFHHVGPIYTKSIRQQVMHTQRPDVISRDLLSMQINWVKDANKSVNKIAQDANQDAKKT